MPASTHHFTPALPMGVGSTSRAKDTVSSSCVTDVGLGCAVRKGCAPVLDLNLVESRA